jgi:hypothetical protein
MAGSGYLLAVMFFLLLQRGIDLPPASPGEAGGTIFTPGVVATSRLLSTGLGTPRGLSASIFESGALVHF